jgi:tripartite-type tricarboxylate transporter receptor subunit TctC
MMTRRILLAALAFAAALPVHAQEPWPSRPIKFVVPAAAGGTNDVIGRFLQDSLGKTLGQPVIMEYKAGAGGAIASQYVATQPADGYTFLLHGSGLITVPLVQKKPSYDALKDFVPVSLIGTSPMVLMTHPSTPATLDGFVKEARANPGKLEWGSSALGGVGQLAMEAFHEAAGIKGMVMVPFGGAGPSAQALLAGQTKYMLSTPSSSTLGFVREGKMRIIGVSTGKRSPLLPDVPAISEVVPGYAAETWFGLVARTGTPQQAIEKVNEAVTKALAQPEIQEKLRTVFVVPVGGPPQAMGEVMKSDNQLWGKVVKAHGITMD